MRAEVPACAVDLLQAIFAANKAAKRYRDSAQSQYRHCQHGFAGHARREKEYLYFLKDKGIVEACRQGRLSFVGTHKNLGLYRGEGYCFHSTLVPVSYELLDGPQEHFLAEAMPNGAGEGRLKDAVHTLEAIADDTTAFHRLATPWLRSERGEKDIVAEEDGHTSCDLDLEPEDDYADDVFGVDGGFAQFRRGRLDYLWCRDKVSRILRIAKFIRDGQLLGPEIQVVAATCVSSGARVSI